MSKLFFIGDSITAGAWDERGGWANRLIGRVMQMTIDAGFENGNFYCLPYNLGISGATIPDLLAQLKNEIISRFDFDDAKQTAEIVFSIGTNDSVYLVDEKRPRFTDNQFRANVQELIERAQELAKTVSFIGLLPVNDALVDPIPWAPQKAYACRHIQNFEKIIEEACRSYQLAFHPQYERWQNMPDYRNYLIDGVHPNSAGHALMANEIGEFLLTPQFVFRHSA